MLKTPLKFLITIVLTLGLSMSFQSLLAQWTAPTVNPPGGNVPEPINSGSDPQDKSGLLSLTNGLSVFGTTILNGNLSVTSGNITGNGSGITSINGDNIVDGTIDSTEIDANSIQRRVTGDCPAGQYIREISNTGSVTCGVDNSGVSSETDPTVPANIKDGISWYEISGRPNLDASVTIGTCTAGSSIRAIASNGSVTCEVDDGGGVLSACSWVESSQCGARAANGWIDIQCPANKIMTGVGLIGCTDADCDDDSRCQKPRAYCCSY